MLVLASLIAVATVAAPAATAPHPASCTVENQPAGIARSVAPEIPQLLTATAVTGTTVVQVDLSNTGKLLGAYVHVSSGNRILDAAALQTAKEMAYAPEIRSCAPVGGSYAVDIVFGDS